MDLTGRTPAFTIDALRRAIEGRNAEQLINMYADDAELRVVDKNHTPSRPEVFKGKQAIANYLRDVFGRDMTHRVEQEVVGQDRVSFVEACRYPDGTNVLGSMILDLRNGKINRHTIIQAWDE